MDIKTTIAIILIIFLTLGFLFIVGYVIVPRVIEIPRKSKTSSREEMQRSKHPSWSEKLKSQPNPDFPTFDVVHVLSIPNTADKIILLDFHHFFRNILRCRRDGSIVWQADLPTTRQDDVYQNIGWKRRELIAHTWSCYEVILNVESGQIISSTFVGP